MEARRAAAAELFRSAGEIADRIIAAITSEVPEFRDVAPERLTMRETSEADILAIVDAMVRGLPADGIEPTPESVATIRAVVRDGIPLAAVLRAYRVGHALLWEEWSRTVARTAAPEDRSALLESGSALMFKWVDRVSDQLVHEYEAEQDRLARTTSVARADVIARLLAGEVVDPQWAARTLGHPLRRRHVALVLWTPDEDAGALTRLDRAAHALAVGERPLVVPAGTRAVWAWVGSVNGGVVDPSVIAAAGDPAFGVEGFRRSHEQAVEARRVAELAGRRPGTLTRFGDVELLSLCTQDPARARDFVERVLGPLAGDGDAEARLRATLRVHFAEGSNHRAAARRLGLHHNTVIYRLRQAEERLGRPIGDDRLAIELALSLADAVVPA